MKVIQRLFSVSLILISISALITSVTGLIGIDLPSWCRVVLGIVNLVSVPVLIYSSVKSMKEKAESAMPKPGKVPSGNKGKRKRRRKSEVRHEADTGIQ